MKFVNRRRKEKKNTKRMDLQFDAFKIGRTAAAAAESIRTHILSVFGAYVNILTSKCETCGCAHAYMRFVLVHFSLVHSKAE